MNKVENQTINAIRILSAEAVQKANSGHPGLPMGAAPMAYALWAKEMRHNPANPQWTNRDRFVLSAGHGSMLLYSMMHLFGYGLTIEDLQGFRQWGSQTPGHPEFGHTPGVEITTGPLGAGFTAGIGMAMAEANLAAKFNREGYPVIDHNTYILVGDGCLMEGISSEAASLAGTLGLGKVITLYDSNRITIEGSTDIAFTEDVAKRFEAYHWHVVEVEDGNDVDAIQEALRQAKAEKERPSLVIVKTEIGYGCPAKQGKASAHGEPLGVDNLKAAKGNLGWPLDKEFHVPDEVYTHMEALSAQGAAKEEEWNRLLAAYREAHPESARELEHFLSGEVDVDALDSEEFWSFEAKPNATRAVSHTVIQRLAAVVPNLFGGSADLAPSTKTIMEGRGDFNKGNPGGMNLHFGVRELAMAGIVNGIAAHGGHKPYAATFFVFSDYMKPMIRLAALMQLPVTYVLTHDSIGVGEDGPTHQPVEQLASLRSIPNLVVFRPADAKEVAAGWYHAMTNGTAPTALVLTRQNIPHYGNTGRDALKGAYVLLDSKGGTPEVILIASGSEVEFAYGAGLRLQDEGVDARVVSMPSMELFEAQTEEYKEKVLPRAVTKRVAVEAGTSFGWHKYTGLDGKIIAIDTFGASAPAKVVYEKFGITTENVYEAAKSL
ncbi:transketolase [Anaerotalea alkaliphila]|uniref:Transketolase n=1 Tax=Anaerotalea alkaliphila TaxID=2662126 RepID=A0A7X5HVX1_9FIRM|nr:transketolase [Anaerotalea alkaliphila]NDL67632.1 transketolase [Anaerotalea alkaliphila]